MTQQIDFFDQADTADAEARGCVMDLNSVYAHTAPAPPARYDGKSDTWLCPTCHPGGVWSKQKRAGYGNWGGSNVLRCHFCGHIAIMRLTIQHTGERREVPEVTLRFQALDPQRTLQLLAARAEARREQ